MAKQAIYSLNDFLLNSPGSTQNPNLIPTLLGYSGTGTKPIFPIQETPESNALAGSFLIYTTRTTPDALQWWITIEEATYMITAPSIDIATNISQEIQDQCRRLDESANDLMKYLNSVGNFDHQFHYVRVVTRTTPAAEDNEGGRYRLPLVLRYQYVQMAGRGIG